ncbi:Gfo/Idh/MocA family protein [Tateyamaria sp. Alg231-49]|uniref:Gfo/Idh/MocA family protein n=1 Tax=Tateyamaria sp. Alg231-49 TaxID=1922219 RepID=UPI000D54B8ED|nr:Gfo/Idh/MocA family oxidoreductase [Tateyamaria sp. Alg231-49]
MTTTLRFLLSGPGLIGRQHALRLKENENCELVAVVAPNHPKNRAFSEEFNAEFFTDFEDALQRVKPNAVIISSPNKYHYAQSRVCIDARVPFLVEKPVTATLEEAAELARLSRDADVPILVGHHRTHSTLLTTAEAFLASEKFGRLVALQGSALFYKPQSYFEAAPWRTKSGGGPILINLIHEIGLMRHLAGEVMSVAALSSNAMRGFDVEDSLALSLSFSGGALGTYLLSDAAASRKSWEMTSGENPAYPNYSQQTCYHFAGTRGAMDFPSMRVCYYKSDKEASWWEPFETEQLPSERCDPLVRQIEHFVDVIRGLAPPKVSAEDGWQNMRVVDAIAESIRTGATVALDEMTTQAGHP